MKRLLALNTYKEAWKTYQIWKANNTLLNQCA